MAETRGTVYPGGLIALPPDALPGFTTAVIYVVGDPPFLLIGGTTQALPDVIPFPIRASRAGDRVVDATTYIHIFHAWRWWPVSPTKCRLRTNASRTLYHVLIGEALGLQSTAPKPRKAA